LTGAVCELVAVTNSLFSAQCTVGGIIYSEAVVLAEKAHAWVVDVFQPLLGPCHTTKLHRFSVHLLDEFRLRGNLHDGNSAYNEALHKHVKAAYRLTNRKRGQFVEQLIINEAVARLLADDETDKEDDGEGAGDGGGTDEDQYDSTAPRPNRRRRRLQRRRRYSKKRSLANLAASRGIAGLAAALRRSAELDQSHGLYVLEEALQCDETTPFSSSNNLYYGDPSSPRRGCVQYTVRCAPSFHGTPWYDWLRYRGQDGVLRVGQAVVVLNTRARGWQRLVVKRAGKAVSMPECVLTKYGCERLQWDVAEGGAVCLDVIKAEDVVGWLAVEYDWENLSERHGVLVMPTDVPSTEEELRATRFFVNAFVSRECMWAQEDEGESEDEEEGV